jgi:uncharacterized cupin superfamily protein
MASIIQPDAGVPPHIHTRESEGFYIVEGQMEFLLGDKTVVANTGDFVHSPREYLPGTSRHSVIVRNKAQSRAARWAPSSPLQSTDLVTRQPLALAAEGALQ